MKATKIYPISFICFVYILVLLISCQKNSSKSTLPGNPLVPDSAAPLQAPPNLSNYQPFPQKYSFNCPGTPFYGDSLIYPSGNYGSPDYLISPINNPAPGHYHSWPVGLVINDSTGTIDVTKSQTGMRYYIEYVQKGSNDTCLSTMILTGASYLDSIYVQNPRVKNIAEPYFDGNIKMKNICNMDGNCHWVIGNLGNGRFIPMDFNTGFIDLDQSLQDGAFGNPAVNGTTVNINIFYTLNNSNNIQSMQLQLMYYDSASLIPAGTRAEIQNRSSNANVNEILGTGTAPPKPPMIIIVRNQ